MDGARACDRYLIFSIGCRHVVSARTRADSKGPHVETTWCRLIMWALAADPPFHELWALFFFQSFCAHANVDVEPQDLSVLLNASLRAGSSEQRSTMPSLSKLVPLTTSARLPRRSSRLSTSPTRCEATGCFLSWVSRCRLDTPGLSLVEVERTSTVSPEEVDQGCGSGARMANAHDFTMELDGMIGVQLSGGQRLVLSRMMT